MGTRRGGVEVPVPSPQGQTPRFPYLQYKYFHSPPAPAGWGEPLWPFMPESILASHTFPRSTEASCPLGPPKLGLATQCPPRHQLHPKATHSTVNHVSVVLHHDPIQCRHDVARLHASSHPPPRHTDTLQTCMLCKES